MQYVMGYIETQTENILSKAIKRFAKDSDKKPSDIQIIIQKTGVDILRYSLFRNYKRVKNLDYLDILGMKIDLLGTQESAKIYIGACISKYAKELNCKEIDIQLIIYSKDNDNAKPSISLYKEWNFVQFIKLSEIFEN